jgi:two-component SAPR family response regulator/Flp pilus assembly protein TadD
MLARVLIWQSGTYRFLSEYQTALTCIDEALELIPTDERMYAEALRVKGATLYHSGRFQEAITCWESALATYHTINHNVAVLYMDLGNAYMAIGSLRAAEARFSEARSYWHKQHNLTWQCNLLNNLGVLYYLRGDYESAGQTLEGAISLARQSGYRYIEALALVSLAEVHRDLGDWPAGLQAYLQAEPIAREINSHFLLFYIDLGRAIIARLRGEMEQARQLLSTAAEQAASNHDKGLIGLEAGLLSLLSKKPQAATTEFEKAQHHFDPDSHEAIRSQLYLAVAYHQLGQSGVAPAYLDEVLTATSKLETDHFLVVAAADLTPLFKSFRADPRIGALHERIERHRQQVVSLRRKLRRQIVTVPSSPPKLKIRAFGVAEVKLDGKIISNADWKVKLARDLFFYILKHPDGVNKDTAGDAFWPDKTMGQMNLQFKNTLYRLRRALALETEVIEFDKDRNQYRFNPHVDYEYDVELFLDELAQAELESNEAERIKRYKTAISIYCGNYLPEVEGAWVWPERERLWQYYTKATLRVIEFLFESQRYNEALEECYAILSRDETLEEVHRLAMRAQAALGDRPAIERQFERCRAALLREVDVDPSIETFQLYDRLTA